MGQIQKNSDVIEKVVQSIKTARLVNLEEFEQRKEATVIENYMEAMERHRWIERDK